MKRILALRVSFLALALFFSVGSISAQEIFKDIPFDPEGHTLDFYRANPAGPTVFYVPGGNWYKHDKNLYEKLGIALAPHGINLVVPQYGQEQRYPDNLIDVAEAIRWAKANLPAYGISSTQFHLIGHSAGAHLSYMLFTDSRSGLGEADFHSLTLISGLYDINFLVRYGNRWRNWAPLQGWHASPIKTKRLVCLPLTVIYAENDYDVVKRQTKHFLSANAHIGQPLRCFVIPNEDHVTELVNAEYNGLLRIVIDTALSTTTVSTAASPLSVPAPVMGSTDPILTMPPLAETQAVTPAPAQVPAPPAFAETNAPAAQTTPPVPATTPAPFTAESPKLPALETPEAIPPQPAIPPAPKPDVKS